jgi:predicted transcriptional regulator
MKIKKENINFTQVSNELLLDKRVSAKAKGIYAYLYSRPDDWDFSVDRIANDFKDGYKAINGGIKELEELGYIAREKQTNGRNYYYIYQKPQKKAQPAKTASRQKGNQPKSLPGEKGGISNKDNINNTDIEIIKKDTKVSEVKTSSDTEIEKVEEFGNPIVNEIETAIKEACTEIGVLYIPGEKERQVLWNL